MASFYSISSFVRTNYPEYWGEQEYSVDSCVAIHKVSEQWGIFSNFAPAPLTVEGVAFRSSEELFQVLKFSDPGIVRRILDGVTLGGKPCHNCKMAAKSYERQCRRPDWGNMVIDAMKYCLMQKHAQCEPFRQALADSIGRTIVEDQTSFSKRHADAWGVKRQGDTFVGPNLLGRLLMELRDNGTLSYRLPDDALSAIRGCLDA